MVAASFKQQGYTGTWADVLYLYENSSLHSSSAINYKQIL